MDARQPSHPFFVTACDRHGRSPARESLVAGKTFSCKTGYPALPLGCGHPSFIPFAARDASVRWLVLAAGSRADYERVEGGARVFSASILLDGDKDTLYAYLRESSAKTLPHLFRRLETAEPVTFAGGYASRARAGADSWLVGSGPSDLAAGRSSACVTGERGVSHVDELGVAVVGPGGKASSGPGGVAVAWAGGEAVAGEGGVAVSDAPSALEVGPLGLAIGTRHCRFRGGDGAQFVVRHADPVARSLAIATACVGIGGIRPGTWYAFVESRFEPFEANSS